MESRVLVASGQAQPSEPRRELQLPERVGPQAQVQLERELVLAQPALERPEHAQQA